MTRPLLLVVDHDLDALARTEAELARRFGADFRVRGESDSAVALHHVELAAERRDPVALVLADPWLPGLGGAELLRSVRTLHPDAARALLVPWGAWADGRTAAAILRGMSLGDIDYYVLQPWTSPDELFCRTVSEFVQVWSRTVANRRREVVVVGAARDPRGHAVRTLLTRNGIPHAYLDRGSTEAVDLLGEIEAPRPDDADGPLVLWLAALGGRVLLDPTDVEICQAWGIGTDLSVPRGDGGRDEVRDVDLLVVGAGPAGLAAGGLRGSSEGLVTLVCVEARCARRARRARARSSATTSASRAGSPARSWPSEAIQQAWVFGARFVLTRRVTAHRPDRRRGRASWLRGRRLRRGRRAGARGACSPPASAYRRLGVPALERAESAPASTTARTSSEAHATRRARTPSSWAAATRPGRPPSTSQRYAADGDRSSIRGAGPLGERCRATSSTRSRRRPPSRSSPNADVVDASARRVAGSSVVVARPHDPATGARVPADGRLRDDRRAAPHRRGCPTAVAARPLGLRCAPVPTCREAGVESGERDPPLRPRDLRAGPLRGRGRAGGVGQACRVGGRRGIGRRVGGAPVPLARRGGVAVEESGSAGRPRWLTDRATDGQEPGDAQPWAPSR